MRLDAYLVENGIVKSRERAKEHIKKGEVSVNGKPAEKPSYDVSANDKVELTGEVLKYVGRGGLKLEKAVEYFGLELDGKVCMDIGASTGGFTDCMLKNGAALVYAVDVGHDQLDESLKKDDRVVNMERTNINDVDISLLEPLPSFISADVSFVSLKNVIPKISELFGEASEGVLLIKPQFEAGRSAIGKNGIVKDRKVHTAVLKDITAFLAENKLYVRDMTYSPVSGGDGNIEYLAYIVRSCEKLCSRDHRDLADEAFSVLNKR